MQSIMVSLVAGLLAFVPGQTGKSMAVQTHSVCSGLSSAECCAQTLRLKGFRALGERLPKKAVTLVELMCRAPDKKLPPTACRAITIARDLGNAEATQLCTADKVAARCRKDKACKACTQAMGKLSFASSSAACLAVTYTVKARETNVVVIKHAGTAGANAIIVKKRTVLKAK